LISFFRCRGTERATVAALSAALLGATSCDGLLSGDSEPVRIAWKVELPSVDAGWAGSPTPLGDQVISQLGGALQSFVLGSGATAWRLPLRSTGTLGASNVAIAAGRAFVAGADSVYAVDATTGERLWTFVPDSQAALCEITADSLAVYIGTRSHRVYALRADSGTVEWIVDLDSSWSDPGFVNGITRSGDTLYVNALQYLNPSGGLRTAHVIALDRRTGGELWRYVGPDNRNDATRAPRVAGNYLLVADIYPGPTGTGSFYALDRFTGREVWRVRTNGLGPSQAPLERSGVVYVGSQDGWVYAVDLPTGAPLWQTNVEFAVGNIALCGRTLLANNLQIRVLDPIGGRELQALFAEDGIEFPTSAFAVVETNAFFIGNLAAYGLSCAA
jgi:outer membrane protein assembly factor BamB